MDGNAPRVTSEIVRFQYRFRSTAWIAYIFFATVVLSYIGAESIENWACATIIELAAFYPVYVWARRDVLGMPIMPAFGMVTLVYYGLPFVTNHPGLLDYDFSEKWFAASTVATVIVLMTIVWSAIARSAGPRTREIRTLLPEKGAVGILIGCLVAGISFQSDLIFYLISTSSEVVGVVRAILLTLGLVSIFSLSYLLGAGALSGTPRYFFLACAVVFISYEAVSLYLISAAQYSFAAALGYFLGSGRVPWRLLASVLSLLVVLQAGKGDMRLKYSEGGEAEFAPANAIELIKDWLSTGVRNLLVPKPVSDEDPVPLIQRASLMHILLKTQTEAPDKVSYLNGSTYLQIPLLVVPRVIWPDRPNTSETLVQLNEHYGLLTREDAERTSIGWGMIAEANANFGFPGCVGLALVLGTLLGLAQREFGRFPVLSARGVAGLLILTTLTNVEASMAQFLTILAQSFFPLILLASTVMRSSKVIV